MKKNKVLCGALILSAATVGLSGCATDDGTLSRENFAENSFQKNCADIIQFEFSSLSEQQIDELNMFKTFSSQLISSPDKALATRSAVNISDMDPNSTLVKIIKAMEEPDVAAAIKNNDAELYVSLLKERGILPMNYATRSGASDIVKTESIFWVWVVGIAVVAVAYAAVAADVIVIGPNQVAQQASNINLAINSGNDMTFEAQNTTNDKELDIIIDKTVKEVLSDQSVTQQEYAITAVKSVCCN